MDNRDKPIPGLEDEYTGTVRHEKAVHKTHHPVTEKSWKDTGSDCEWVRIGAGRYRLQKKVKDG